jgi:hypothetical protein
MVPIEVKPDRITIGPEFLPRRLDLPRTLVVPVGQTVTLADGAVLDYVEVAGTLTVSRMHSTTARITTLVILPGGTLDLGTVTNPMPAGLAVTILIRDVPIDTTRDPFQWGNGIVNFGTRNAFAPYKTPAVEMADTVVGATTITLSAPVQGWRVGDELIFPDTKFHGYPERPDVEPTTTIAGLSGQTVTLSRPLTFAHTSVFGLDGRLGVHPKAVNITRSLVVRSENPLGTRGHQANIGGAACWDVQGTASIGLGRTTVAVIDSTSTDLSHIGTNQLGKYAWHEHHADTHEDKDLCPRQTLNNVYVGIGSGKWGHVTHATHDTLVQDDIAIGFPGAGFITEDGYEVRNQFLGCLAINNWSPFLDGSHLNARENRDNNQPGIEGTGFWFHGVQQIMDRCEAWGNTTGFNWFARDGKTGMYPSAPGVMPDTPFEFPWVNVRAFIKCDHTVAVGNSQHGMESWDLPNTPIFDNYVGINNLNGALISAGTAFQTAWYRHPTIIGSFPTGDGRPVDGGVLYFSQVGIRIVTGYSTVFKITNNAYVSGVGSAILGLVNGVEIADDTILQGAVGLNFDARIADIYTQIAEGTIAFQFSNTVKFLPYGLHPPRYIISDFDSRTVWDGTGEFPLGGNVPPPPPPPDPVWTTLTGTFQQDDSMPPRFRFCTDAGMTVCTLYTKA